MLPEKPRREKTTHTHKKHVQRYSREQEVYEYRNIVLRFSFLVTQCVLFLFYLVFNHFSPTEIRDLLYKEDMAKTPVGQIDPF